MKHNSDDYIIHSLLVDDMMLLFIFEVINAATWNKWSQAQIVVAHSKTSSCLFDLQMGSDVGCSTLVVPAEAEAKKQQKREIDQATLITK